MRSIQGPVVQSLTIPLVVKMLTALVSTLSNSQVYLLKKILTYTPYLMISFNDTLTNDIISFEQLGPGYNRTQ